MIKSKSDRRQEDASKHATANVRKIRSLMEYFYRETKNKAFQTAVDELDTIRIGFNDIIITKATSPYFLRFQTEIMNLDVESLLNYDYESLIDPTTEADTDKTIRSLIALIKEMWIKGTEKQRIRIKRDIITLLKLSILFDDTMRQLSRG